jgi:3-oxoacyl-[acyl-carrier protein] reductase
MKVTVVTGASSGIGQQICQAFLHEGWKVYGLSRTKPSFVDKNFTWLKTDISQSNQLTASLKNIPEKQIDAVISNAGIVLEESASHVSISSYEKTFSVNVLAPMLLVSMLKDKIQSSTIVSISSVSDRLPGIDMALYCSSKAANTLYFDTLAREMSGARVFTLLPDYVDTPMLRNSPPHEDDFNWNEIIKPSDIAKLTIKLTLRQMSVESGANIIVASEALKESFNSSEKLYGFNTDSELLIKLNN